MKTLALDLATNTGFAVLANGTTTSGSVSFERKSQEEHQGARFLRFQRWLRDRIALDKPGVIVFEEPMGHFKSAAAGFIIIGLRGIMLSTASYYGIPVHGVPQTKLKKWATGKGNAKKEDMILAMRKRWPDLPFDTNDECDALLLLRYWMEQSGA